MKIILGPLDSRTAQAIANRRGVSIETLMSNLIREEAAIELTGWRASVPMLAQPTAQEDNLTKQSTGGQSDRSKSC